MKPSSGRYSIWFQTVWLLSGCSDSSSCANATLKRQKSTSSDAASISAWNAVFDCPSIVAATTVDRQVVVSSSAARRNTAARSSKDQLDHSALALTAAAAA